MHLVDATSTSSEICLTCSEDWHSLSRILFKRIQLRVLADVPVDVLQQCIIFLSLQYDNVDGELFRPIIGVDYEHELFFEHN
jgi:hypothetical protein